jgi:hypothetical protein
MKSGIVLIQEERSRQRGPTFTFTDEHDNELINGELTDLAEHYLDEADPANPQEYVRNLVKAGAAIAAEIDRVVRSTGGTITFSEQHRGIHQEGGDDPDNRDGSQANAQADQPVRTPVGRDDNKDGRLAGGDKPVLEEEEPEKAGTRANTVPSTADRNREANKKAKAAAKRSKAVEKAKSRGARPRR